MAGPARKLSELFYEIRARTEGLSKDVADSERQLGKLSTFIRANPVAAVGAVATAIAGIAVQATRMAAEIESSMRRVATAVPEGTQGIADLRKEIESLSRETGRTQSELAAASEQIAKIGSQSATEVATRLRAAVEAAQASGEDLQTIIAGLDQTLDLFGLQAGNAREALAELFAAARGRTDLNDVFQSLEAAAPSIQRLGLDLPTAARALVALGESGLTAGQAAKELRKLATEGDEGRKKVEALAASLPATQNALLDLATAADEANNSQENLTARLRAELSAELLDLGDRILPAAIAGLRGLVNLIDVLRGGNQAQVAGALSTVLLEYERAFSVTGADAEGRMSSLKRAVLQVVDAVEDGRLALRSLDVETLKALGDRLTTLSRAPIFSEQQKRSIEQLRDQVLQTVKAIDAGTVKGQNADRPTNTGTTSAGVFTGIDSAEVAKVKAELDRIAPLSQDAVEAIKRAQREAVQLRLRFVEALIATGRATVDTFVEQIALIEETLRQSGVPPEQIGIFRDAQLGIKGLEESLRDLQRATQDALGKGLRQLSDAAEKDQKAAENRARSNKQLADDAQSRGRDAGRMIEDIGKLTLATADAFGVLSDEAAKALSAIIDVGAGIARIFGGDVKGGSIQTISGVIQLASQAFGKDPAAEERRRQHNENLTALREIERHTGDLVRVSASGSTITASIAGVEQLLALTGEAGGFRRFGDKGPLRNINEADFLEGVTGLPFAEIDALAKSLGITLNGTKQSYLDFIAALKSLDFAAFTDTFAGQLQALRLDFEIFDIDEPREQLEKFLDLLTDPEKGAPAIFGPLKDFDLGTAEGVAGFTSKLREIWTSFKNGDFDPADFPGLNMEEIIASFGSIDAWVEAIGAQLDAAIQEDIAARANQRTQLGQELGFEDITAPDKVLGAQVKLFGDQFAQFVGDTFKDIDLSTPEGLADFDLKLKLLRLNFLANAEAMGLTQEEIDEFLAGLYDLESGADAAEAAIKSLADTLNEEFSDIELQGRIFGTDAATVTGQKLQAFGVSGDLSTESGRAAVIAALRQRATGETDTAILQIIADLIAEVQRLGGQTSGGAGAGDGAGGERTAITSAATALTERTGNRMADFLATDLIIQREHSELLTAIRDRLGGAVTFAPVDPAQLIRPPVLSSPQSFAAAPADAGVQVQVGPITIELPEGSISPGTLSLSGEGRTALRRLAREVSALLAEEIVTKRRLSGDVSVS
jgi:hypothetical protein